MQKSHNENKFTARFPIWMLVNQEHPARGLLRTNGSAGEVGCPLFTDRDLAERYRDSIPPIAHYELGLIENPKQFNSLLETLASQGITHVTFDSTNKAGRFNPLSEVREAINREARDN